MAEMTASELRQLAEKATGDPLDIATYNLRYAENLPQLIIELVDKVKQQAQEIAKKDRMLERATWVLDRTGSCPKTCDLMRNLCAARACWTEWLEKEAEVHG